MRGEAERQVPLMTLTTPERRVPQDHPIRRIKALADAELARLSPVFETMYSERGRPSIPPEVLLKSCLLIALYSVRSERQFCERLQYDLLFRFFLDLNLDEDAFDASSFAKNKQRLLEADVARRFFEGVVQQAKAGRLLSPEHFTVDGTLLEAWASLKSFRPKGEGPRDRRPPDDPGNPTVNFHGEQRTNTTHWSLTDLDALLTRKGAGKEAKLAFSLNVLMENRHGLCVDVSVARATGYAEREEALRMVRRQRANGIAAKTLGADKAYDTADFVTALRTEGITPHVAEHITMYRGSNLDCRTTRHPGYALSQRARKRIEEIFGWGKTIGGWRKSRYRGLERNGFWAYLVAATYNLVRMTKLLPAPA
jgi:transposase